MGTPKLASSAFWNSWVAVDSGEKTFSVSAICFRCEISSAAVPASTARYAQSTRRAMVAPTFAESWPRYTNSATWDSVRGIVSGSSR